MKITKPLILVFLLLLGIGMQAQNRINSPYSRFGLGYLFGKNNNTELHGMGGISIGYADPTMINAANPASYGVIDSAAFIFEAGVFANFQTLKTTTLSEGGYFASLNYIYLGFPVTRWWRSSFGLIPFSKVGYDVDILVEVEGFSNVENSIEGDGGMNQVFWGNAFNIGENLRLGINSTYVFGEARRRSVVDFVDSLLILGTKVENSVRARDFIFDYGVQYDIHMANSQKLTVGLVYANQFKIGAEREYLATTIFNAVDEAGVDVVKDTIVFIPEEKGDLVLPTRMGIGAVYRNTDRWLIGADFEWQNWENFEAFDQPDSLFNSWKVAVGGAFTPKHTSLSSTFKRMTYRLGLRYESTYLNTGRLPINEFGISFGFKFPLRRSKTTLDLSAEIGRRGTTKEQLIQENFVNFTFGVSIHEHWFHKRKYQ